MELPLNQHRCSRYHFGAGTVKQLWRVSMEQDTVWPQYSSLLVIPIGSGSPTVSIQLKLGFHIM